MRIERLDLLRYGRFTDASVELPARDVDFHIVFGLNEAGKSTALTAIEDWLFGIPKNTPYNFLHPNNMMRIGGVLANDTQRLAFRRRKGNKDTILSETDEPLAGAEAELAVLLSGLDREFMRRMFGLNPVRLVEGGKAMLDAGDSAGEALFVAGTGLIGLRSHLQQLEAEAGDIWAPRRSGSRSYYTALNQLDDAERAMREYTLTAPKWQEAERVRDEAERAFTELDEQRQQLDVENRRLSRIRRVHRNIARLTAIQSELSALGTTPSLPDGAPTRLAEAVQSLSEANAALVPLAGQLKEQQDEVAELAIEEDLLANEDEIRELCKQRINVQKEQSDLPRRRSDLDRMRGKLKEDARGLGWDIEDIDDIVLRIPQHAQIVSVRELATQRGALWAAVGSTTSSLTDIENDLKASRGALRELAPAADVSALSAVVAGGQPARDLDAKIVAASDDWADCRADIALQLAELQPAVADEGELERVVVPPQNLAQALRDELRSLAERLRQLDSQIAGKDQELRSLKEGLERRIETEGIVTPEALHATRERRGTGWHLIRARFIDRKEVPEVDIARFCGEGNSLAGIFEQDMQHADTLADQRFDKAAAAGQVAEQERRAGELQTGLLALCAERDKVATQQCEAEAEWQAAWGTQPFTLLDPDTMQAWLARRARVLTSLADARKAERRVTSLRAEEAAVRQMLASELDRVVPHEGALDGKPLRFLLDRAASVCREHARRAEQREALAAEVQKQEREAAKCQRESAAARESWRNWQASWSSQLQRLGLDPGLAEQAASAQLDDLEMLRTTAREMRHFESDRIQAMESDIKAFAHDVARFVQRTSIRVMATEPTEVIAELEARIDTANRLKAQLDELERNAAGLREKIQAQQATRALAQGIIDGLQRVVGVETLPDLQATVQRAERRNQLLAEQKELEATVLADGDDHTLDELRKECVSTDLETAAQRALQIEPLLRDMQGKLQQAALDRADARRKAEAIGTGDDALLAAGQREEALSAPRERAEHYVRSRATATILGWTVEQYQREKQGPLLKRAAAIFATLTRQSFAGLRTEFDDSDHAHLVGMRPDGGAVGVAGMSDGTADQLYLALRLAAVHEHFERSPAVPFIADDLFVNFDNERAAAGFKVLAELATRTQVLFFTHHQHLVDVARATLGDGVSVRDLAESDGG